MTLEGQILKHIKGGSGNDFQREYNRLVDLVSKLQRSLMTLGVIDSSGLPTRRHPQSAYAKPRIFEVQSAGTGDGIYNCYRQSIDATEWADTAGDDKFDDLDTTSVEVFNAFENDPEATYTDALATKDRLLAWRLTDDEGNARWVGTPIAGGQVRMARTTAAAGATTTIACNLVGQDGSEISSGLGSGITVYCSVAGGGNLNAAIPRLAENDFIYVTNLNGVWCCTTVFQKSQECP